MASKRVKKKVYRRQMKELRIDWHQPQDIYEWNDCYPPRKRAKYKALFVRSC